MPRRVGLSLSLPIVLSSIAVALCAALLVGWIYVLVRNLRLSEQVVQHAWLLVAGIVSFLTIITVLVLFSVFLAREILEVRRQTSFIDSVTHELRSPLASLRLCLETLGREGLAEAQRATLRDMMLDDVERLTAFIDDILEASRLGHGQVATANNEVSLRDLIDDSIRVVKRRHRATAGEIVVDVPPEISLTTDAIALEMVLKNLIDNALKYSEAPYHIAIQARTSEDGHIHVLVTDRGLGIERRDLKRIFERFYRVPEEAVRERRGVGLGLFVVSAVVKQLGGSIHAFSEGRGKGTQLEVILPRVPRRLRGERRQDAEQNA